MKTILLVDDDQPLRALFGSILRKRGYDVIEADSGVAGLELARKHRPDLILSDIEMPGGGGSILLREIRRDPELWSRQFVLMSGRTDLVPSRIRIEEGADDFLTKPVSLQGLLNCMAVRFSCPSISWRASDQRSRSFP